MEHGDVARLLNVADADVKKFMETDTEVFVKLSDGAERVITEDGVFAVNSAASNRSLRPWSGGCSGWDPDNVVAPEDGDPYTEDEGGVRHYEPQWLETDVSGVEESPVETVPEGTADEVLSWVDGDPDRAALAIETEERREKPRSVLLGNLRKVSQA